MKALILNSGVGRRMGVLTSEHPKCMTDISKRDTILSRQLKHRGRNLIGKNDLESCKRTGSHPFLELSTRTHVMSGKHKN